jgi:hypothetical protein
MRLPPGQLALMAPCRALHTPAAISLPAPVTVSTISYLVGFVKHHPQEPCAPIRQGIRVGTGLAERFFRIRQHGGAA